MTVMVPSPALPNGAFANHGRPNALLSEMPSGPLTAGSPAVAAVGLLRRFRNAGLFAVYSCTRPPCALAWPPPAAKSGGTVTPPSPRSMDGSIDRIEPGAWSGRARGAP
jgi:hypothetical protein